MLWKYKPLNFKQWKQLAEAIFIKKLNMFLKENNNYSPFLFKQIYQVVFYYGFVNFRKELMLKTYLENKGFNVQIPSLKTDSIFQIDLIAQNSNQKLFLQLKSNYKINVKNIEKLKMLAFKHNATPFLVTKVKTTFKFWNFSKNVFDEI